MKFYDIDGILREQQGSQDRFFRFIYGHMLTRAFISPFLRPWFSKLGGRFMDSRFSARFIPKFIRKNSIDMTSFEKREFYSFNDFFTRRIKTDARPLPDAENALFSPCDAYLSVLPLREGLRFTVKHTEYSLSEFLRDEELSERFLGGTVLLLRLAVQLVIGIVIRDDDALVGLDVVQVMLARVHPEVEGRIQRLELHHEVRHAQHHAP